MAARPTDTPRWASGPAADIANPPAATKTSGWVPGVKPPNSWFNWWMNLVYQWILYLQSGGLFDDLAEAADTLAVGEMAIVFENDNDVGPGNEAFTRDTGMIVTSTVTCDIEVSSTQVVVAFNDMDPIAVPRDLDGAQSGGTPAVTYVRTFTGAVSRIRTDGTTVVAIYGSYVEAFDAVTGASLWLHDHGAVTPIDLCMDATQVYIVSGATGVAAGNRVANRHVHALNKATGAVVWTYRHSATVVSVTACCTNGRQLFISGAASGYASAATRRALRASDGADYDNESGSTLADTDGLAWNAIDAVNCTIQCLECDGRFLYGGYDSTSSSQLRVLSLADGTTAFGYADPDPAASAACLAVDQDFVYLATNAGGAPPVGYVKAFNKGSDAVVWQWGWTGGAATHAAVVGLCSDGQAVFAIANTAQRVFRVTRGNVPTRYRKVDPDVELSRYRNWVLQPEAQ